MSNVVRSAAVRLTMENASYIRGANQSATVTEQATGRMQRAVRNTAVSTGRDWDTMGKYGGRTALVIGTGLGFAEKRIISFDKTMSAAGAATEATAAQQEKLRAAAIKAGADTAFTTTEAAQAITEEGKAGIRTADILSGGLSGALNLAAAGSIDVASAAEDMSTALVQFHLKGGQATHVADLLAASANKAQGEVGDMSLALSYVGVPAHAARISLEETVGTIALLAKNGLIGEKAGTSLRGMLASLQSPSKQASKIMKDLGINVYDAHGRFKGFDGVAQELKTHLGGLTDQERQYALGKIFGNEQLQAANILYEQGARGVRKMTREVNDQGYASEVANKKLDNLAGDWERFTGSLESAFIKAGTPAQGALRDLVQNGEHLVNAFATLPDEVQAGVVKIAVLAAAVGGVLYTVSKIRNVASDIRGLGTGRGAAAGGLRGAASLAAPVPVFVTNLGAGGLGGAAGKGGGTTVLGGGAAAAEGKLFGKIPLKYISRGNVAVGLAALVLEGLGVGSKTHAGSTLSLAGAGSFLGVPGTVGGAIVGGGIDIYHSGNSNKSALNRALDALDSGTMKEKKAALAEINVEIGKLQHGGNGQNFNRFVTAVSGRGPELLEVRDALAGVVDVDKKAQLKNLRFLLDPNYKGKRPNAGAAVTDAAKGIDALLNPDRKGGKRRVKEKTSEEVLADFYGINTRKLKPVDLLSDITGIANVFGKPGKGGGKRAKNPVTQLEASLGLNTGSFDKKAKGAQHKGAQLNAMKIAPKISANTGPAMAQLGKFGSYLASLTRPRSVEVTAHIHKGSVGAGGAGDIGSLLTPADGVTVPGARGVYGDRVPALLAPTEEVISNRQGQADRWRPLLKAINANRFADGGTAGGAYSSYAAGAGITVLFPTPAALASAVAAADAIAGSAAKVDRTARDIRQQGLDDLHTQQQIRDLQRDLQARNKKHRLQLRGLDRQAAQAELADAKANLAEIRRQKQTDLEEARQAAIDDQVQRRQDATDALTSTGDVFARGSSPGAALSSVNRAIADISTYGQVIASLKSAGASPALLQQLVNRAEQGDFRSAIRLGRALLAQPATLGQLNTSLATLGSVSSSVATMTTDPRFLGTGAWAPTSTSVVQVNLAADPSSWLTMMKVTIQHEVEAALARAVR